ncbi:MAG: hypothetical protein NW224_10570 [Leptolyngbyaceae cyanobacterium bins.302]|nr:hypothetical protein [Leptolyngbyaceae cyanobacterium bins.302]
MEEHKARKQPPQGYQISYNLAHQPYPSPALEDEPLEEDREDRTVVPMPAKPRAAEPGAEESPRSPSKRKPSGSGKGRSTAGKTKATPVYRSAQPPKQQPFADELQHLEELAERINHILAERARRKAYLEQSQPMQSQAMWGMAEMDPRMARQYPPQQVPPQVPPQSIYEPLPLEEQDTENLKLQAKRIRHRLSQLEVLMDASQPSEPFAPALDENFDYYQPPQATPSPRSFNSPYPQPSYPPQNSFDSVRQRNEYEAQRIAAELRQLKQQEYQSYREERRDRASPNPGFESIAGQALSQFKRLPFGRFLQLPRKPMDGLSDAIMWIAVAAIARIGSRYLVASLPVLSPVITLLMLAPAAIAIFLALFVPKTGWIPFYRLFLIMLGLLIGGKFF